MMLDKLLGLYVVGAAVVVTMLAISFAVTALTFELLFYRPLMARLYPVG